MTQTSHSTAGFLTLFGEPIFVMIATVIHVDQSSLVIFEYETPNLYISTTSISFSSLQAG